MQYRAAATMTPNTTQSMVLDENGLALLTARHVVEDRAGGEQQCGEQDVLQAAGVDHEERVGHGQRGQDQVALALLRPHLVGLAAPRDHQAVGGDEEVRDQRGRAGQAQHQRERIARPVGRDHDELDDDAGRPHRHDRHVVLVGPGEGLGHVLRLAGGEHHFGADQRPGQVGAEHRDQQAHADEDRAPGPDHRLEHRRHRRLAHAGDVGTLHHGIGQQGYQHHQAGDDDEAE